MSSSTTVADRLLLVTGATRGIGQALVEEALRRDAKQVYAGTRQPLAHDNDRVAYLILDVTNAAQVQAAVARVESLDILINNAGRGVRVHAVLPGPVDTDMSRGADVPKASPESVSRAIFDGGERGGGDLPRSLVRVHGRELAQQCGQRARAQVRGARSSRDRTS